MLHAAQIWLVAAIEAHSPVATLMHTHWAWPVVESLHFIGLCLLVGAIGSFDLRLLGVARRVPIAAVHRLIPWGIAGFVLNACTGLLFVLTEPDQYIYNPSFHLKVLSLAIAGANAGLFYVTTFKQVFGPAPVLDAPRRAKAIALVSLCAWMSVIVCGRMLTFYRPGPCDGDRGVLLTCEPE